MIYDLVDGKKIFTEEKLKRSVIDLANYDEVSAGESPLASIPSLRDGLEDMIKREGFDIVILSNERSSPGVMVNKYKYDYKAYKEKEAQS